MPHVSVEQLVTDIAGFESLDESRQQSLNRELKQLVSEQPDQVDSLMLQLSQLDSRRFPTIEPIVSSLLAIIAARTKSLDSGDLGTASGVPASSTIAKLFAATPENAKLRFQLLRLLANIRNDESLSELAKLIVQQPPQTDAHVLEVFEPLFASTPYDPTPLFPKLFELIEHPKAACAVIDLANFVFRSSYTNEHPAVSEHPDSGEQSRLPVMRQLLKGLVQRLQVIEENPLQQTDDPGRIAETVTDSASLIIALCDLLAQCEGGSNRNDDDPPLDSITILKQANSLAHRRIRAEASVALTKLGEESGKQSLIELAGDASVRMRVLKYAEELEILDEIEDDFMSPEAIAESRLAMWLAQPRQMGVPPTSCQLIDERTQFWPGYDEPVECWLFRFSYEMGSAVYENAGIVGPLTHAFTGSLIDLPVSEIYAGFAGWQAEHEEILEFDIADLNPHYQTDVERLKRRLHDASFESITPKLFGKFFGQNVLVAEAQKEEHSGIAIVDTDAESWLPNGESQNHLSVEEAWSIYKGRNLLQAFN